MSNLYESFKEVFLYRLNEGYKEVKTRFVKDGASEDEVSKLLDFHKSLKDMRRLPNQDLNIDTLAKGKSFEGLKNYLSKYSEKDIATKTDMFADLQKKIVGQNDKYIVYKIDTPEEMYLFHGKVKWCTSSGTKERAATHFKGYSSRSNFYVAVSKIVEYPNDYLAIQVFEEGLYPQFTVWDAEDVSHKYKIIDELIKDFSLPKFKFEYFIVTPESMGYVKNPDGTYNYDGDVYSSELIHFIKDGKFTIKFKKITGNFVCYNNKLTSLEGSPEEVGEDFICSYNNLTSLKGAPKEVGSCFYCSDNQLTSLEGGPEKVKGRIFDCSGNLLNSLKGAPKEISGTFACYDNQLTSLEGGPEKVGGSFDCARNNLTSLKGAPKEVGRDFTCKSNKLTSLNGCPKEISGYFDCSNNNLTSLEGAPKEVGDCFYCSGNKKHFSKEEVEAASNIKGIIYV